MIRKIIKIDEDKCDDCGLCVSARHEGAIGMADGKAKFMRDDYFDGLGDCLPVCPTGAISFEEREAAEYDEAAVSADAEKRPPKALARGCPGTHSKTVERKESMATQAEQNKTTLTQLNQWPVQIKLAPVNAPYFNDASLLIAADRAAYAYGDFHSEFMRNKITLIGARNLATEIIPKNRLLS